MNMLNFLVSIALGAGLYAVAFRIGWKLGERQGRRMTADQVMEIGVELALIRESQEATLNALKKRP